MLSPLRDLVVYKPSTAEKKVGDIFITNSTKSTRNQTFDYVEVLASGPKVKSAVKGTTIFVSELAGDEWGEFRIVRERDIAGVVK